MNFKIEFKDGRPTIENKTLDDIVQFRIENVGKESEFTISMMDGKPIPKPTQPKKPKTVSEEEAAKLRKKQLEDFKKTLTENQKIEIAAGTKTMKYSSVIGYYLQVVHKNTQFYSPQEAKKQKESLILSLVKDVIIMQLDECMHTGTALNIVAGQDKYKEISDISFEDIVTKYNYILQRIKNIQ